MQYIEICVNTVRRTQKVLWLKPLAITSPSVAAIHVSWSLVNTDRWLGESQWFAVECAFNRLLRDVLS